MRKRIIIPFLLIITTILSSCSTITYVTSKTSRDNVNTNKSNSIKIDKNSSDSKIVPSRFFNKIKLNSGYNALETNDMKRVYKAVKAHATAFTDKPSGADGRKSYLSQSFTVVNCNVTKRQLAEVFIAFDMDNPQMFWLDEPYAFSLYGGDVTLTLYFTMKKAEYKKRLGQLNSAVNNILRGFKQDMSDFDRELYLHDYIVKNCKYDKKADNNKNHDPYTIYGCLINQKAVCSGYTRAFQYLLSYAGIKSITVDGSDTDSGHVWNAVKLGGKWYYTDVTWDDINDISMYDYFNVTTAQLLKTHSILPDISYFDDDKLFGKDGTIKSCNLIIPVCKSLDYNYYVYKGSMLNDLSDNTLASDLAEIARRGEDYLHIYVNPDALSFQTVYNQLFSSELYLFADYIDEANSILGRDALSTSVSVTRKDDLNVISVKLSYK